jgi:hypothetical protein
MRPLIVAVAVLVLSVPVRSSAQERVRSEPAPSQATERPTLVGEAVHWCVFNRPCNWTSHASIALGVTYGLSRLDVPRGYAAGAAALLFVGKEFRDQAKWGNVLGTPDSMGDMLSGIAGATVGYLLLREVSRPVELAVTEEGSMAVGVRLGTR